MRPSPQFSKAVQLLCWLGECPDLLVFRKSDERLPRLGEKLVVWTDETPPLDTILSIITLYWITGTFPTSIYHYRVAYGRNVDDRDQAAMVTNKPVGYSQFPHEILPIPAALVKARHNVTWSARHDKVSRKQQSDHIGRI